MMDQAITGPVPALAPARWTNLLAAFCRKPARAAFAVALAAITFSCQPGTEPIDDRLTGSISVAVSGLPSGAQASVTVTGPGAYQRAVTGSETLSGLALGSYTIASASVNASGDGFAPALGSQAIALTTANPAASVSVVYGASTGRLQVTITGVPAGGSAAVEVSGPGGYSRAVSVSELLTGLSPGEYTVTSSLITSGGSSYLAAPSTQAVTVAAGATETANVAYFATAGSLGVTIAGLPAGTPAQVSLAGPNGFSQALTESRLLDGLAPGSYTLDAAPVSSGGVTYYPAPLSQTMTVYAGQTASAAVGYAAPGGAADLRIQAAYLTQATQRLDGSVPLVAGRDAYLRVFAVTNMTSTLQPAVRVGLFQGTTLVQTYTIPAPGSSVPLSADESALANSWNVLVPGALVVPGLAVLAEVDPANAVPESDESNNQFPGSGVPATLEVRALPTFGVRLVPVLQANGLQGNVTSGNLETFLTDVKQMLPVGAYDADLRDVYTTSAPILEANNGNNAWNTVLAELLALRTADASTRYYYGVVKVNYTSGSAGMAYVGGSARTAVGWDKLPSGSRVMAHELGHNMGRTHAPCGSLAGADPNYPYSGGVIGAWGLSLNELVLKPPTMADLLGYCQPVWVSDYNWTAMVAYRAGGPNNAPEAIAGWQDGRTAGTEPSGDDGVLVWGRVTPEGIVLEPSFRVPFSAALAPRGGRHLVELLRADGSVLSAARFDLAEVADLPGFPERHFALVLPAGADAGGPAGVRVRIEGRMAEQRSPAGAPDPRPTVSRVGTDRIAVRWDATRYPMVLVRNPATGRILSFARNGSATLWSRATELELQFSDGVRTTARRERVLR